MTTRTGSPGAIVLPPGRIVPGLARGVAPLRREGPAKLTGAAKYTDDLVFPGAWYGTTDPIHRCPRATRWRSTWTPAFDWSTVVVVTAADIPGDNIVSSIKSDQPILVPVGGEIQHHAEPLALLAAPDRATLRAAWRHDPPRTEPLPPVFDPLDSDHVFARYAIGVGRCRRGASPRADLVLEGEYRVGPPGAAVHREQRDDRRARARTAASRSTARCSARTTCTRALKRALGLTTTQARVIQAETGGGFGGKEEYPSIIGLHAALLARRPAARSG